VWYLPCGFVTAGREGFGEPTSSTCWRFVKLGVLSGGGSGMVLIQGLASGGVAFTIRPHDSMGWKWMKRLFAVLATCIGLVALWFTSQGAWLVLPFAGMELLVLGIGIYFNALWIANREVIQIEGENLSVWRGRRQLLEVVRFPRHWTRVRLITDPRGWYPSRLFLEYRGKRIEVGNVLVEGEREALVADLRKKLSFLTASQQDIEPVSESQALGTARQQA